MSGPGAVAAPPSGTLLERVYRKLWDGNWYTLVELVNHCGGSETSVSARLRDLRKEQFGGHDIRKRVDKDSGAFVYSMRSRHDLTGTTPDEAEPLLGWELGTDRYHAVSIPRGFTVAVKHDGDGRRSYAAWDVRPKLNDPHAMAVPLGVFSDQVAAKQCADDEYRKGLQP